MHKKEITALALSIVLSSGLVADVPDLTEAMEPMCNPNATRWTASQPMACAATSIGVCDGLLFVSGGDWDDNLGPCPIFAVNPYTGAYVNEFDSGTESIDYFRVGSDGCLYAPSVDPRESHANECNVARRNADGTWTPLKIAPNRWIDGSYYGTHTWDVAIWKGKIFTAGYGIDGSDDFSDLIKRKKLTAVRMSGQNEIRTGSRKKIVFSRLMIKYNRIIFRSN